MKQLKIKRLRISLIMIFSLLISSSDIFVNQSYGNIINTETQNFIQKISSNPPAGSPFIILKTAFDATINIRMAAVADNTPVWIETEPNNFIELTIGMDWSSTMTYSVSGNVLKIYGDLGKFDCPDNGASLTGLDCSGCPSLQVIGCYNNSLTELNVTGCNNVVFISCRDNALESLDVSDCSSLKALVCYNNSFTTEGLDILYCNLYDITGMDQPGLIFPIDNVSSASLPIVQGTNSNNANDKNWFVRDYETHEDIITTGTYDCSNIPIPSECDPVINLAGVVDGNKVLLSWNAPAKDRDVILTEGFETTPLFNIPNGWLNIDSDGDGEFWYVLGPQIWLNPHGGSNVLSSWSFTTKPVTPDNYIITKKVEGATDLTYYLSIHPNYPSEHYAVMVSSSGTDISDFITVFEETAVAVSTPSGMSNDSWQEKNIELPAGTKYIAFRHYNCTNQSYLLIDDVIVTGTKPTPTGEVAYYDIYQNNIKIASEITETVFEHENVEAGVYNYCVEAIYDNDCVSEKVCVEVTIEDNSYCPPVTNLVAENDGSNVRLNWDVPAEVILKEGFESTPLFSIPEGWLNIDGDGDGDFWYVIGPQLWLTPYEGSNVLSSWSFTTEPVTPDNYIITKNVEGATALTYYLSIHPNYPAEHYAVMVSSSGTDITDFTTIFEETAIAVSPPSGMNNDDWQEKRIELPEGTKYIAFRHYNCTNQSYLLIDNIIVFGSNVSSVDNISYNVYQDNIKIASEINELEYVLSNVEPGNYTYCVEAVYGNGCISDKECVDVVILGVGDNSSINIYPNPAKDVVKIEGLIVETVTIYNSLGQLVDKIKSNEVDVSGYPSGMYIFNIETLEGMSHKIKVLVRK